MQSKKDASHDIEQSKTFALKWTRICFPIELGLAWEPNPVFILCFVELTWHFSRAEFGQWEALGSLDFTFAASDQWSDLSLRM